MARPAVFLDRDGTLNEDRGYVYQVDDFAWLPGAREAVARLNAAGLFTVLVTNQAGVARGLYEEADIEQLHAWMQDDLASVGAHLDALYYAPYHVEGVVERYAIMHPDRKPDTGMLERAIREHDLDPARSFMVGDKTTDLIPGRALGMTTILVETGYGLRDRDTAPADYIVPGITEAAALTLTRQA